jgi:hypothetical protein
MVQMMRWVACCVLSFALHGCAAPELAHPVAPIVVSGLDSSPDLSAYGRFDLTALASGSRPDEKRAGSASFVRNAGLIELRLDGEQSIGRLFLQPEACRDDVSGDCERRFALAGSVSAFGASVSCYIPVRNDTRKGYTAQSLVGVCRDSNGRSFSLNLYAGS